VEDFAHNWGGEDRGGYEHLMSRGLEAGPKRNEAKLNQRKKSVQGRKRKSGSDGTKTAAVPGWSGKKGVMISSTKEGRGGKESEMWRLR